MFGNLVKRLASKHGYPARRARTTRVRNGVREALFGGYVSWDGRKNFCGYRQRTTKEIRVWGPAAIDDTDCGAGTDLVVSLLKAKAGKRRNVEVVESWRY